MDRTARNANMLMWHRKLWLIDHGAALYFHHGWGDGIYRSANVFAPIEDHVLLRFASALAEADAAWLASDKAFATPALVREAYVQHLSRRLQAPRAFLEEAQRARALLV